MESLLSLRPRNLSLQSLPWRRGFAILTAADQNPPWNRFHGIAVSLSSLRLTKPPSWNHFHGVVVSLSSLRPTKPLRGNTSTASQFHYPHCDRPIPFVESLPRRRGFTILTATDQTPWIHFHGATDSLFSLRPPYTPPWNHFHGAVDPLPRIFLPETVFVRLGAAVTFPASPYSSVNCHMLTDRSACFSTTPNSTPFPQPHQRLPLATTASLP